MPRKEKKRPNLAARRKKTRYIKAAVLGVVALALVGGVAYAARLPEVTIAHIDISGARRADAGAIEQTIRSGLSGSYALIVPKDNALFYPRTHLVDAVKEDFESVKSVTITRNGLTALAVAIEERDAIAVWCSMESTSSPCYQMDDQGLLFATVEGSGDTLVYRSSTLSMGDTFLAGDFPKLSSFVGKLAATTGRTPTTVTVDGNDDVFVTFKEGGELRFTRAFDPDALVANVTSVFSSKRFSTGEPFVYVDFRFGNKVYVKFVGE